MSEHLKEHRALQTTAQMTSRKTKRRRVIELSMKVMEIALLSPGERVSATQKGWDITIAKRDGLTFTYCTAKAEDSLGYRPYCLAMRPSRMRVVQVCVADGAVSTPAFFAESDEDHLPKARLFLRGDWEENVLALAEAVFAAIMGWSGDAATSRGGDDE